LTIKKQYENAKKVFLLADKQHKHIEGRPDTINDYLRNLPISKEDSIFAAQWELGLLDEFEGKKDIIESKSKDFEHYPALCSNFLFSTRFRRLIDSFKVIIYLFIVTNLRFRVSIFLTSR
jgi:hypothetical protein